MLDKSNSTSIRQQIQDDIDELYYQLISIFTGKCQKIKCNSFLKNHVKFYLRGEKRKIATPDSYYSMRNVNGEVPCMWFEIDSDDLSDIKIISDVIDERKLIIIPIVKDAIERLKTEDKRYYSDIGSSLVNFFMYPIISILVSSPHDMRNGCALRKLNLEAELYTAKFFEMIGYDDDRIIDLMQKSSCIGAHDYLLYLYDDVKDIRFDDFGSLSTYMTDTFLRGSLFERSWFEKLG